MNPATDQLDSTREMWMEEKGAQGQEALTFKHHSQPCGAPQGPLQSFCV